MSQTLTSEQLEQRWQSLRPMLEKGQVEACRQTIASEHDRVARNQIYRHAIRKLGGGSGATSKDLDLMIDLGRAAIANALATSEEDPERSSAWIDEANISAFNLSANLCDCWGDGDSRKRRHFEAGLAFADQALAFRRQLKKGPGPFSMAHWMRGKHLLSLQRAGEASDSFAASLLCEEKLAAERGMSAQPSETSPASLLLSYAFLGLAQVRAGDSSGLTVLETGKDLLKAQMEKSDSQLRDEAKAYLEQLDEAARRN